MTMSPVILCVAVNVYVAANVHVAGNNVVGINIFHFLIFLRQNCKFGFCGLQKTLDEVKKVSSTKGSKSMFLWVFGPKKFEITDLPF